MGSGSFRCERRSGEWIGSRRRGCGDSYAAENEERKCVLKVQKIGEEVNGKEGPLQPVENRYHVCRDDQPGAGDHGSIHPLTEHHNAEEE